MKKSLIVLLLILLCLNKRMYAQHAVAQQWHFSADNGGNTDWVLGILPTDNKEYIAVGYTGNPTVPVIIKLDHRGKLVWAHSLTSFTYGGTTYTNTYGFFRAVVKTAYGYAAVGFSGGAGGRVLLAEFDESGNYINSTPQLILPAEAGSGITATSANAWTIAMDPSGQGEYIIGGGAIVTSNSFGLAHITKVNYSSHSVSSHFVWGTGTGGNSIKKVLVKGTSSSSYTIYACGYKSMPGLPNDNTNNSDHNKNGSVITVTTHNKDIWLLSLSNSFSLNYDVTYNKSNLGSILYQDNGPVSAKDVLFSSNSEGNLSPAVKDYLTESVNQDERAYDMIFTQDGNLALTAIVNVISTGSNGDPGNGSNFVENSFTVGSETFQIADRVRSGVNYDEYFDGDVYLLKADISNGSISGSVGWNKNVAHFSGGDFLPHLIQLTQGIGTNQGDYVIAGTTADYYTAANDPDLALGGEYDAFIVATHDCSSSATLTSSACVTNTNTYDIWRRNTHAHNEDGLCVFDIKRTADDGFIICGDNDNDGDDFTITKFSPPYAEHQTYDLTGTYYVSGSQTWNTNKTIAAHVIVPYGATLTIDGCTISFASTDHLYDYSEIQGSWTANLTVGIVVNPGGHLIIKNNAVLQGLNSCGKRYMWDGIVVQGNPSSTQTPTNQGKVDINSGASLVDSRFGIIAGDGYRTGVATNVNYTSSGYTLGTSSWTSTGPNGSWWSDMAVKAFNLNGGAILAIDHSNFVNCLNGISMCQYNSNNIGTVTSSTFKSDANAMADICWYADASGHTMPSLTHFYAYGIRAMSVQDNNFLCDNSFIKANRPLGISLLDAGLLVSWTSSSGPGNRFSNLLKGITSSSSPGASSISLRVSHNDFYNNGVGVSVSGNMNALHIGANTFEVPGCKIISMIGDDYYPGSWAGIVLAGCHGYDVSLNSFSSANSPTQGLMFSNGIIVNGGTGTYNELVYQNTFRDIYSGAVALGYNACLSYADGLQFKCNDFSGYAMHDICRVSQFQNGTGPTIYGSTLRNPQGDCYSVSSPYYYKGPAGNRFLHGCTSYTTTWINGNTKYLYADNYVTEPVVYHNNQPGTQYDPGSCIVSTVGSTTVNYNNSCSTGISNSTPNSQPCPALYSYTPFIVAMHNDLNAVDAQLSNMRQDDPNYPGTVTEHDALVSANARNYAFNDFPDSAAYLLESYGQYADAFPFYMQIGDYHSASRMYNALPTDNDDEALYKYIAGLALNLTEQGGSWFDLDSTTVDSLTKVTQINSAPGYMTGAITALLNVRPVDWPMPINDTTDYNDTTGNGGKAASYPHTPPLSSINAQNSFTLYPNPNNGNFTANASSDGTLSVYTIVGQEVESYKITAGKNVLKLPTGLLPGVYLGQFKAAGSETPVIIRITYKP